MGPRHHHAAMISVRDRDVDMGRPRRGGHTGSRRGGHGGVVIRVPGGRPRRGGHTGSRRGGHGGVVIRVPGAAATEGSPYKVLNSPFSIFNSQFLEGIDETTRSPPPRPPQGAPGPGPPVDLPQPRAARCAPAAGGLGAGALRRLVRLRPVVRRGSDRAADLLGAPAPRPGPGARTRPSRLRPARPAARRRLHRLPLALRRGRRPAGSDGRPLRRLRCRPDLYGRRRRAARLAARRAQRRRSAARHPAAAARPRWRRAG